ncbi:T9SS type A sorting domain-containing protein [Maribacter aestuarii]|uniref:T9SS type A sorting domain-containing protein n=1 Tax=Maribacter aestuarii TaxID=1130723 RepID=UPI00248C81D3|nr:T9SS type A sorting domain-containing protein [Maribacter aestuarii]
MIEIDYDFTPNTVLTFDFRSDTEGEIHEVAFNQNTLDLNQRTGAVVYGNQGYAGDFTAAPYPGDGTWQSYSVPIGTRINGTFRYMVLITDDDASAEGDSYFRNITLFEDTNGNGTPDECGTPEPCTGTDVPTATVAGTDETVTGASDGSITFTFQEDAVNGGTRTAMEFSIDGGATWPQAYSVPDDSGSFTVQDLAPGDYRIFTRWGEGDCEQDLGTTTIAEGGTCPDSDNDGVCDDDDICEGSDDSIDSDNDGIPDGCDSDTCEEVTVSILFDDYARETSWELLNSNGVAVLSGSGYTNADDFTTLTESVCLEQGCYDFVIYDSYGDGICCGQYGDGNYSVTKSDGTILASGGTFTTSESTNFCIGSTPLTARLPVLGSNIDKNHLILSPVPANSHINLEFEFKSQNVELLVIEIFDFSGKLVISQNINSEGFNGRLDISQLSNGTYLLKLKGENQILSKQFIVKH